MLIIIKTLINNSLISEDFFIDPELVKINYHERGSCFRLDIGNICVKQISDRQLDMDISLLYKLRRLIINRFDIEILLSYEKDTDKWTISIRPIEPDTLISPKNGTIQCQK